jgi:eukaryotic-like serine/threonine-protein kinase
MSRKAALKTLRPELGKDKKQLKRFYHEARAASALTSPHVVRIYDFGIDDESKTPFIAWSTSRGVT